MEFENKNSDKKIFGLIGYPLSHSFSQKYFTDKFDKENIENIEYHLFQLNEIVEIEKLIQEHPNIAGLNVTIPYKEAVLKHLDEINKEAAKVGAVNVIKIRNGKRIGFNSDIYGFEHSLLNFLNFKTALKALVLGTGGALKAISYVLKKLGIEFQFVSRTKEEGQLTYRELSPPIISDHKLIINCTPLGTYPNVDQCPSLPYEHISSSHYFYDLVYNPPISLF